MTAQLEMFEPQGAELAKLVQHHLAVADRFLKQGQNLSDRFCITSASFYISSASESFEKAQVCECAYLFESLAVLV